MSSKILSDKEYLVLSYILLNLERPGVFRGEVEEISRATGIPLSEVKLILEKSLKEKGVIKILGEPTLEDVIKNVESQLNKVKHRDVSDETIHKIITIKDKYSDFLKMLREIVKHMRTKEDTIDYVFVSKLIKLNGQLEPYRLLLSSRLKKVMYVFEKEGYEKGLIEVLRMNLLLYPFIPVMDKSIVNSPDGNPVTINKPNIHLIKKRTEFLEEASKYIAQLIDENTIHLNKDHKLGLLSLYTSLNSELDILKTLYTITKYINEVSIGD